ncbi:MAG: hypothetical protein J6B98_00030 [Bacilli bacterium]|nr:hypothetical protein [Bacilli bacterium]
MDTTILISIGVVVLVLTFAVVVSYLLKNSSIRKEDLETVKQVFKLTTNVIDELNLKQEEQIMSISQIVVSSLDFAIVISNDDDQIKDEAYKQAILLCEQFKLELTEERKNIILQLINIGLDAIYFKDENSKYCRRQLV